MVRGRGGAAAARIGLLFEAGSVAGLSDWQLLRRWAERRDQAAFTALVQTHGPLVLAVGRRHLRDSRDVEDAFQATFLILARKAGSLRPGANLSTWLYEVSRRVALRARADAERRRLREGQGDAPVELAVVGLDPEFSDLGPLLDEELARLPATYRAAVVLCDLEGRTHADAAQALGWPIGTVKGRLSRARALLRDRLTRRGLAMGVPTLANGLDVLPRVLVPEGWADLAAKGALEMSGRVGIGAATAAATLAQGVLTQMACKTWITTAVVAFSVLASGAGAVGLARSGDTPGPQDSPATRSAEGGRGVPGTATAERESADAGNLATFQVHGEDLGPGPVVVGDFVEIRLRQSGEGKDEVLVDDAEILGYSRLPVEFKAHSSQTTAELAVPKALLPRLVSLQQEGKLSYRLLGAGGKAVAPGASRADAGVKASSPVEFAFPLDNSQILERRDELRLPGTYVSLMKRNAPSEPVQPLTPVLADARVVRLLEIAGPPRRWQLVVKVPENRRDELTELRDKDRLTIGTMHWDRSTEEMARELLAAGGAGDPSLEDVRTALLKYDEVARSNRHGDSDPKLVEVRNGLRYVLVQHHARAAKWDQGPPTSISQFSVLIPPNLPAESRPMVGDFIEVWGVDENWREIEKIIPKTAVIEFDAIGSGGESRFRARIEVPTALLDQLNDLQKANSLLPKLVERSVERQAQELLEDLPETSRSDLLDEIRDSVQKLRNLKRLVRSPADPAIAAARRRLEELLRRYPSEAETPRPAPAGTSRVGGAGGTPGAASTTAAKPGTAEASAAEAYGLVARSYKDAKTTADLVHDWSERLRDAEAAGSPGPLRAAEKHLERMQQLESIARDRYQRQPNSTPPLDWLAARYFRDRAAQNAADLTARGTSGAAVPGNPGSSKPSGPLQIEAEGPSDPSTGQRPRVVVRQEQNGGSTTLRGETITLDPETGRMSAVGSGSLSAGREPAVAPTPSALAARIARAERGELNPDERRELIQVLEDLKKIRALWKDVAPGGG